MAELLRAMDRCEIEGCWEPRGGGGSSSHPSLRCDAHENTCRMDACTKPGKGGLCSMHQSREYRAAEKRLKERSGKSAKNFSIEDAIEMVRSHGHTVVLSSDSIEDTYNAYAIEQA